MSLNQWAESGKMLSLITLSAKWTTKLANSHHLLGEKSELKPQIKWLAKVAHCFAVLTPVWEEHIQLQECTNTDCVCVCVFVCAWCLVSQHKDLCRQPFVGTGAMHLCNRPGRHGDKATLNAALSQRPIQVFWKSSVRWPALGRGVRRHDKSARPGWNIILGLMTSHSRLSGAGAAEGAGQRFIVKLMEQIWPHTDMHLNPWHNILSCCHMWFHRAAWLL